MLQTYGDGERCRKADTDNTDQTTTGAKYLYYGDPAVCKKFYDKGNGIYELTVDFSSPWGFLIRTSNTDWGNHKYGAASTSTRLKYGEPFALKQGEDAEDIMFESMNYGIITLILYSLLCRP